MLGCFNSLHVSKNANKSKVGFDKNLVAEATSYMFATKTLQNQFWSIYRTQETFIQSKNIRITRVVQADHEIL
jgi:hypothetical protein